MNEPTTAVTIERLRWRCDAEELGLQATDELPDLAEMIGQPRALDAVKFGIGIRHEGYNLFVLGPPGVGKRTIVRQFLESQSADETAPDDWCYVENFQDSEAPHALRLPAGRAVALRGHMESLIEDLSNAIPAAIEVEEHQSRVAEVENAAKQRNDLAFQELADKAKARGIQLIRTPGGFAFAPLQDETVVSPEDFEKLPDDQKKNIEATVGELQQELQDLVERVPQWRKEVREKVKQINREVTSLVIKKSLSQVKQKYQDLPAVLKYLDEVEEDVCEQADEFRPVDDEPAIMLGVNTSDRDEFPCYTVNVLVDNSATQGAPVIYEDHPNYHNLLGRVEHQTQMGALVTDFTRIKSGSLHRANGGYLVVDARRLLEQPYAWDSLKRALFSHRIQVESLAESLSLVSTLSLDAEPIPLDVKVILLGDRMLYYLLYERDPDFAELFKVSADFEDAMDRTPESCRLYARLIATLVRREQLRSFDAAAVARVIEQAARLADDRLKLTTHIREISDLLREADYWASQSQAEAVSSTHVQQAIDKQVYRVERIRERVQEQIERETLMIDTDGRRVGQINGLSVLDLGNFRFGRPSRITATSRIGKGDVVDIEREVDLGGAIHSKGVLILSAFLAARYAKDQPLSLSASLVFEQSYGMVDGDSASVAELVALLSSLSETSIDQSLAVTGSVNQHGQVQPIGGVNEKIEGFFDVCTAKGLTGRQGVVIPASNVEQLMLREDVVDAVANGQFRVHAVTSVDEAIELLMGTPAGERNEEGEYPSGSVNGKVAKRLSETAKLLKQFDDKPNSAGESA